MHINKYDVDASKNCNKCKRLFVYRNNLKNQFPAWHNSPVNSFGSIKSEILILGLAPGKRGANRTGRPFTGDGAGKVLFNELLKNGYAIGKYDENGKDDLNLINCRISNIVKCVPPKNKPIAIEFKNCRNFLINEINTMKNLRVILSLGNESFKTVNLIYKTKGKFKFKHNEIYKLNGNVFLVSSFHCSRYNINTKRLSLNSFEEIFKTIKTLIMNDF